MHPELLGHRLRSAAMARRRARPPPPNADPPQTNAPTSASDEPLSPAELRQAFGSHSAVLHICSDSLLAGLASDSSPVSIPSAVACSNSSSSFPSSDPPLASLSRSAERDAALSRLSPSNSSPKPASLTSTRQPASPPPPAPSPPSCSSVLAVGSDALHMQRFHGPNSVRIVHPLAQGRLHPNTNNPLSRLREQLIALIHHALVHVRGLSDDHLHDLSCVLVVSQRASYSDIRELTAATFALGIQSIAIHRDSVAASFGVGALNACAVCLDSHYASAVCLDDGAEIESTRFIAPYGSDHVALSLAYIMNLHSALPSELDISHSASELRMLLDALYLHCWCASDDVKSHESMSRSEIRLMLLRDQGSSEKQYTINCGALGSIAGGGLFDPALLGPESSFAWEQEARLSIASNEEISASTQRTSFGRRKPQAAWQSDGIQAEQKRSVRGSTRQRRHDSTEREAMDGEFDDDGPLQWGRSSRNGRQADTVSSKGHPNENANDFWAKAEGDVDWDDEHERREQDVDVQMEDAEDAEAGKSGTGATSVSQQQSVFVDRSTTIAQVVAKSILTSPTVSHARHCESIILYGNGSKLHGLHEAMEARLLRELPEGPEYNTIDVRSVNSDSRHSAWLGGALAASIDPNQQSQWVTKAEWESGGARPDRKRTESIHLYGALHTYMSEASLGPTEPL